MLKKGLSSEIKFQKNNKRVILLIHGFRNSPTLLKELSEQLYNKGYSIYNLRLPGHGNQNEDEILKIKLRDWESYVENILLDLSDRFEQVFCCGLSLGAVLIMQLAEKYNNIKKMVLFSPFFKLKQKRACLGSIVSIFVKKLKPSKIDCTIERPEFKDFISFFPIKQGYEIYKLLKKVRKKISKVSVPALCFLARDDHDISYQSNFNFVKKNTSFKIITLEKSRHNITIDVEKELVFKETINFFNS